VICFQPSWPILQRWERSTGTAGIEDLPVDKRARKVRDYLAGMTDTYAIAAHRRLFDHTPDLR
jgi:dGTP triphosphohydrolase